MRSNIAIGCCIAFLLATVPGAVAEECPGNPDALGTSRTITVKPSDYPRVGTEQYDETLRLKNREVVITFDDGPMPPYTNKILETLAEECVKATFFVLGANVAETPELVRRAFHEGHTIGTHTFTHGHLDNMPFAEAKKDIEKGIAVANEALGNKRDLAPFFRAPYLDITEEIEKYFALSGIMIWSIDIDAEDWTKITDTQLIDLVISRLEKAGKGILLLHDIQPVTALALPKLLAELKRRNFHIVHVVPEGAPQPKNLTRIN